MSTAVDDPWERSLFELKAGGIDEALNKEIKELIMVTDRFAVYLDADLKVQWRTTEAQVWDPSSNDVLNKVAILESRSSFIEDTAILASVRRQIAEGLVRCLDDPGTGSAKIILMEAEKELQIRNKEASWAWYFHAAHWCTLGCAVALLVLWVSRAALKDVVGITGFDVLLGSLCGSVGALISVTSRGDRLHLDASAGKWLHRLEAVSRIGVGVAGAALTALAIKGGIILGGTHFDGSKLALLLAFCIAAGASERLVPNLITNFEQFEKTLAPSEDVEKLPAAPKNM